MSKITFEDKEDIRTVDLPRKNYVGAADINEIKSAVNSVALLTHEVTLTKAQLNSINTDGGIELPLSEFGCAAGQSILLIKDYCIVEVFRDGVDFNSGSEPISILQDGAAIYRIDSVAINIALDSKYGHAIYKAGINPFLTGNYFFTCINDITGGGANAYIKIKFYYQIITV